MSDRKRNLIDYIVACVNEFAETHGLDIPAGFDYLRDHQGISFLERNYDIEHTYSIDEAVADMAAICRKNGGTLA